MFETPTIVMSSPWCRLALSEFHRIRLSEHTPRWDKEADARRQITGLSSRIAAIMHPFTSCAFEARRPSARHVHEGKDPGCAALPAPGFSDHMRTTLERDRPPYM